MSEFANALVENALAEKEETYELRNLLQKIFTKTPELATLRDEEGNTIFHHLLRSNADAEDIKILWNTLSMEHIKHLSKRLPFNSDEQLGGKHCSSGPRPVSEIWRQCSITIPSTPPNLKGESGYCFPQKHRRSISAFSHCKWIRSLHRDVQRYR